MAKLKRIDYIGNAIFVPSLVSILLGLTYGGTQWPWSSWHIVVPLVCGFFGFGAFLAYEASRFCLEPTTPPRLFANRTSAAAFALTFLHSLLTFWTVYYLPVYFQAVLRSTPSRSGVQLLPTVTVLIPFAALSGKFLARIGRYRPFHHLGFALMIIGLGLFTLLDSTSPTGAWVGFQIIEAAGAGLVVSTLLPAVQVGLSETDTATAAGTFAFIRSFGIIWGVAIPAAIFNTQSGKLSYRVSDPAVRASLANGQAYEHATREFVLSFQGNLRYEITGVYSDSLKVVWQVALGIACLGFLLVSVEKELTLRTSVKSDFGMVRKEATIHPEDADDVPLRAV